MKWVVNLVILLIQQCLIYHACADVPYGEVPLMSADENYHQYSGIDGDTDYQNSEFNTYLQDDELEQMEHYLATLLVMPWNHRGGMPLLYVEQNPGNTYVVSNNDYDMPTFANGPIKRSRYFRMYPFKRQNTKQGYDNENIYMCQPTKEEVFKLLMALQEARQRNTKGSTINFCKRKRPTATIFSNIRFLS